MSLHIRPATRADADAIAALHAESWQSAYRGMLPDAFLDGPVLLDRQRVWRERLAAVDPTRLFLRVALEGDALVGFVCVLLDAEPGCGALLDNLHVAPARKGRGIGRRLFEAAWERARSADAVPLYLWVFEANHPARRFYERLGGTLDGTRIIEVVPGALVPEVRYVWRAPGA